LDLHHISWIVFDAQKKHPTQAATLGRIFSEHAVHFLAMRHVQPPVAAGDRHTCALQADGKLVCFGDNRYGQCDVPAGVGPVVAVAAGYGHTCALQADGKLVCFGDNEDGRCDVPAGVGPVVAQCDIPVELGLIHAALGGQVIGSQFVNTARGSHEVLEASRTEIVIQSVDHADCAAADIDPQEAANTANELWASGVERLMSASPAAMESSLAGSRRALLLTFSRCPRELENAILNSAPARALIECGVDVQPAEFGGMKVLVEGVELSQLEIPLAGEPPRPYHLVVYEEDEAAIKAALENLPYSVRKLKPQTGRRFVPSDLALLDVSSEGDHDIVDDTVDMIEYRVVGTFIHIAPVDDGKTVQTW